MALVRKVSFVSLGVIFNGKEGGFSLSQCGDSPFPSTAFFRMSWEGFELPTFGKSVCRG